MARSISGTGGNETGRRAGGDGLCGAAAEGVEEDLRRVRPCFSTQKASLPLDRDGGGGVDISEAERYTGSSVNVAVLLISEKSNDDRDDLLSLDDCDDDEDEDLEERMVLRLDLRSSGSKELASSI